MVSSFEKKAIIAGVGLLTLTINGPYEYNHNMPSPVYSHTISGTVKSIVYENKFPTPIWDPEPRTYTCTLATKDGEVSFINYGKEVFNPNCKDQNCKDHLINEGDTLELRLQDHQKALVDAKDLPAIFKDNIVSINGNPYQKN